MAEKTNVTPDKAKSAEPVLTLAGHELRNHFAGIALAEIVRNQMANNRFGQEDVAASLAWRYADRMIEAGKRVSRSTVVSKGVVTEPTPEPAPGAPAPLDALSQVE